MIYELENYKEKALLERYLGEIKRRNYLGKEAIRGLDRVRKKGYDDLRELAFYQDIFAESIPPAELYWVTMGLRYLEGRDVKYEEPTTIIYSLADNYDSKFSKFLREMKKENSFGESKRKRLGIHLDGKIFGKVAPFRIKEERDFFEYMVQWAQYLGLYGDGNEKIEERIKDNFEEMMKRIYFDILQELRKSYGKNVYKLYEMDYDNLIKDIIAVAKAVRNRNGLKIDDPELLKKEIFDIGKEIREELQDFGKTIERGTNVIISIIDDLRCSGLLPRYREIYKKLE